MSCSNRDTSLRDLSIMTLGIPSCITICLSHLTQEGMETICSDLKIPSDAQCRKIPEVTQMTPTP